MPMDHSQPKGFSIFFLTEMWERYGFYVIQTVLVFYLLQRLNLNDSQTYIIVGSFTALAYINSLFGGLIADRFIGYDKAVIIGGLMLLIGYAILGVGKTLPPISLGLACVTAGTGMLKPNVSSMLSILYKNGDSRKDAGYTLYYVGIYVGATSGGLLGGYLQTWFNWQASFASSALGIIFALVIFIYGMKKYKLTDHRHTNIYGMDILKSIVSVLVLVVISYFVLQSQTLSLIYFTLIAVFCLSFVLYHIITSTGVVRSKLIAFLFLIFLSILYWAIYFQQFFSIGLATQRTVQLNVPESAIPAIESFGVIIFGPIINYIWFKFQDRGHFVSIAMKYSFGFLYNSICFLILAGGMYYAYKSGMYLSIWFIVVAYLLVSIGELCLSPTSLSMVPSLVPEKLTSAMMGISLLSIGFGGKLAGFLASSAEINLTNNGMSDMKYTYMKSFFSYFIISLLTFVVAIALKKFITKLIEKQEG